MTVDRLSLLAQPPLNSGGGGGVVLREEGVGGEVRQERMWGGMRGGSCREIGVLPLAEERKRERERETSSVRAGIPSGRRTVEGG